MQASRNGKDLMYQDSAYVLSKIILVHADAVCVENAPGTFQIAKDVIV